MGQMILIPLMSTAVDGTATWEICVGLIEGRCVVSGSEAQQSFAAEAKGSTAPRVTLPSAFTTEQSARCTALGMLGNAWYACC